MANTGQCPDDLGTVKFTIENSIVYCDRSNPCGPIELVDIRKIALKTLKV